MDNKVNCPADKIDGAIFTLNSMSLSTKTLVKVWLGNTQVVRVLKKTDFSSFCRHAILKFSSKISMGTLQSRWRAKTPNKLNMKDNVLRLLICLARPIWFNLFPMWSNIFPVWPNIFPVWPKIFLMLPRIFLMWPKNIHPSKARGGFVLGAGSIFLKFMHCRIEDDYLICQWH